MNIVKKIYTNGTVEECKEQMSLEQMQDFIEGPFAYRPSTHRKRVVVINEDALRLKLPQNLEATKLVRKDVLTRNGIRGNALLAKH